MGFLETAGSISAAEKIGWLSLFGGTLIAFVKVIKWIATFSEEHRLLLEHLKKASPLMDDIIILRETTKQAKLERTEILSEVRQLRTEVLAFALKDRHDRA